MERSVERSVVVKIKESAGRRGAVAVKGFIESNNHAATQIARENIDRVEIEEQVVHWVSIDDFEEYEAGHNLPRGTFKRIFRALIEDYAGSSRQNSALHQLRLRRSSEDSEKTVFAAEDMQAIALGIIEGDIKVKGVRETKARYLYNASTVAMAEPDIDNPPIN